MPERVTAEGVAQAAQHAERQRPRRVGALALQPVLTPDEIGQQRLGPALGPAALEEVRPGAAPGRDEVPHLRAGLVDDPRAGARWRTRIEISVSSHPIGRPRSRPMPETKPPTASSASRRKAMLAPIALRTSAVVVGMPVYEQPITQLNSSGNQPGCSSSQTGDERSAGARDHRVVEHGRELRQPVRLGGRVVVEERDDVARRRGDAGVAGAREALRAVVLHEHDRPVRPRRARALEQRGVVIDRDDHLVRGARLGLDGRDGVAQRVPPLVGVGRDDHGHRELAGTGVRGVRGHRIESTQATVAGSGTTRVS